jgi:large subunit ribosomal protein L13
MMKTYSPTAKELEHKWHVVDADGVVLGRLASKVAQVIRGKHKPTFAPHMDGGDFVVVVNAEKVRLTGKKPDQKRYFRHTGYMGHERFTPLRTMLEKHPERVIEKAVFGMLPKTTLGKQALRKKLKVYAGPDHPHAGQNPAPLDLK